MQNPDSDRTASPGQEADPARYNTLMDYVRVVRRNRVLIVATTLVLGLAGFVYAKTRPVTYKAEAQISIADPFQDLGLLSNFTPSPQEAPAVRAANAASLVTSPRVARRAARILKRPPGGCSIRPRVLVETYNVAIDGTCRSAPDAGRFTNAYARATRAVGNAQARAQIGRVAGAVRQQLAEAQSASGGAITKSGIAALQQQLSRIQTLQNAASPVQIVDPAVAPSRAASPRTVRDTGIGLAAGLLLGLLVAFGRDALDRRLHSSHEVHEAFGLPVLGRISRSALGHPGLARNGVGAMTEADFEPFRVLRMNLTYLAGGSAVRSVLVTSSRPEEGKSTVSASLASAAVLAGQRTLLVECDLRRPSFEHRLGIRGHPGLTDYLLGTAGPQEILQTVELAEPARINGTAGAVTGATAGTLVCIAGGTRVASGAELLVGDRFRDFLEKVSKAYDLVVLDGSPLLAVVDPLQILPHVDAVIICARAEHTTHEQARAARAALSALPDRPMGTVLTGIRRSDPDAYDYYGY